MKIPMQYKKHLFLVNDDGFEDDKDNESEADFFFTKGFTPLTHSHYRFSSEPTLPFPPLSRQKQNFNES